jgi:crotonobetainyl-CoA:carnitine CoA-transferase CaiB-like acyl-CoA transferase
VQIGDLAGGGMASVIAILSALMRKSATGVGDFCDISMMDGAFSWLSIHAAEYLATKKEPRREQMHLSGAYPCYRVYPAADGWLTVGALEPQFWSALCTAIDRTDLLGDAFATGERREEVIADLEKFFAQKSRAEWMEALDGLDVCVGPVNSFGEAFADEQLNARSMLVQSDVPGVGDWSHVGNPIKLEGGSKELVRLPPPEMGEHTDEVLREAGVSAEEIQDLRASGVL